MNKQKETYYALYYSKDDLIEVWAGPCKTREAALSAAELNLLETFSSKSKKYMPRLNNMFTATKTEAKYLKVIKE